MFNVQKTKSPPASLAKQKKHDAPDVINQLASDFHGKCYLCGDKINKDLRVEHFVPHEKKPELKCDWNNLFLACDFCNGIKSDTYNKPGTEIINPLKNNPEDSISHKVTPFPIMDPKIDKKREHPYVDNTIRLLNRIFTDGITSSAAQKTKREDLVQNLKNEMKDFFNLIYDLLSDETGPNMKEVYKVQLKDHLEAGSRFIEFKREFVNETKLNKKLTF